MKSRERLDRASSYFRYYYSELFSELNKIKQKKFQVIYQFYERFFMLPLHGMLMIRFFFSCAIKYISIQCYTSKGMEIMCF